MKAEMKAVVIGRYGGNDAVELAEVPVPSPQRNDLLIKVHAASINPIDWKIRNGMLKIITGGSFPKILGLECAGEVVATGSDVRQFQIGDHVVGFTGVGRLGAFAEYVCVSAGSSFAKPATVGYEQASTLPIAGLTALQALRDLGGIKPGDEVLINGASGGVGTFAVQVAKIFGAHVTAVCSAANAELVHHCGADRVLDYAREDFTTGIERYQIVFDTVAKRSFAECKRVLSANGVYVTTLPAPSVLMNQYLLGVFTGRRAKMVVARPNAADMAWMFDHIEAGRIRVIIDRVYPLGGIEEAFAYSESGKARGKVVLRV